VSSEQTQMPFAAAQEGAGVQLAPSPSAEVMSPEIPSNSAILIASKRQRILGRVRTHCPGEIRQFESAYKDKSRKDVIAAKCLDCTGYEQEEVRHCPCSECPLWGLRPYQSK
jgi:hypothetical protein